MATLAQRTVFIRQLHPNLIDRMSAKINLINFLLGRTQDCDEDQEARADYFIPAVRKFLQLYGEVEVFETI